MNIHKFGQYIQEFKDLYTEEEYYKLMDQWHEEYQQYLIDQVKYKKKD